MTNIAVAPARATTKGPARTTLALALAAMVACTFALQGVLADVPRAQVTVRNHTPWDVTMYVREGDAVSPILTIGARHESTIREVAVPGGPWKLVWRFKGEDIATSTVDDRGRDLVIAVPDDVERALRARHAPPSP
jgi:hypothetical protein